MTSNCEPIPEYGIFFIIYTLFIIYIISSLRLFFMIAEYITGIPIIDKLDRHEKIIHKLIILAGIAGLIFKFAGECNLKF